MNITNKILKEAININVASAIDEDIKSLDKTSAITSLKLNAISEVKAKGKGILCGRPWFEKTYKKIDPKIKFTWLVEEGDSFKKNQTICKIHGKCNSILIGERIALNFIQTLSGTATITKTFVNKIKGTSTILLDTRKTLPGLRIAQKYADKIGGGMNQRLGLYDEILVKETFLGSSLMASVSNKSPGELRIDVTSPGGVTEAALEEFNKNSIFKNIIEKAIKSCLLYTSDAADE